jgi:hypothetical protein
MNFGSGGKALKREDYDMKKIYLLTYNFTENESYCVNSVTDNFNKYRFYNGEIIDDWPDNIKFEFFGDSCEDFLLGGLHWRLVSENVRKVFIRENIPGVQFLPVHVVYLPFRKEIGPYWVMNVLFDETQTPNNNNIKWDIFRRRASIYITERLKVLLENENVTSGAGFELMPC